MNEIRIHFRTAQSLAYAICHIKNIVFDRSLGERKYFDIEISIH